MMTNAGLQESHRIVSSESEELILVDEADNELGFSSKAACHDGDGVLHRAFSLFLFNDRGELLLQQRSVSKRLWPGFWSNSICSHPRRGESMEEATRRRLFDELNIESRLEYVYKFAYQAQFGDDGSENELCHVFLGRVPLEIRPNEHEIAAVRFISAADLDNEFRERPDTLTPWFQMEWQTLNTDYRDCLAEYAALAE
jgi:isopentenyl-diphosphate delta-isomerase